VAFIEEVKEKRKEIIGAIKHTEYKYFGDYEFSEAQHDAVGVLVNIAKAALKAAENTEGWICENCGPVENEEVTFQERHESCRARCV